MTTDTAILPFTRVLLPGRIPTTGAGTRGDVFVTVKWSDDGRLSITAVEGPDQHGNAAGGAGQCRDALERIGKYRPGWDAATVARLRDVWERWHLNDMRAGCEHQRAAGWSDRPIDPDKPTDSYGIHFEGQQSPSWNLLGWVRPDEHPGGLLTRECEECGYRYGTAWVREDVPADVVEWLRDLPQAERKHPWGDRDRVPVSDPGDLECYGCGTTGDYDTFGLPVRCPVCRSLSVHSRTNPPRPEGLPS